MSILASHHHVWWLGCQEHQFKGRVFREPYFGCFCIDFTSQRSLLFKGQYFASACNQSTRQSWPFFSSKQNDEMNPDENEDGIKRREFFEGETDPMNNELLRENLERIVGTDDSTFSGIDLATLIRNKYGRSYDVQLIKKEFMGRNLLALNVMWKYVEQRSFPLTEEEYLLRLDDVANTLKCWGAVSHIRNSLEKLKERPRIGKAVSIFIDMDESGGRANEWIYK